MDLFVWESAFELSDQHEQVVDEDQDNHFNFQSFAAAAGCLAGGDFVNAFQHREARGHREAREHCFFDSGGAPRQTPR